MISPIRIRRLFAASALLAAAACSSDTGTPASSDAVIAPATEAAPAATAPPATEAIPPETDTPEPTTTAPPATDLPDTAPEPPTYDFSALTPVVQDFVDERGLNGAGLIIVDREDGVIHEEQWGEFTPDRISLIASSSKMITAGVLLRLQEDGLLDIDAPVADVADWGAGNPDITPAQLISNSSGLVGLLPDPTYGAYICQYLAAGTLQECAASVFTTADDDADVIAPDTQFRYGGAQWQVAGAVAEAASGKSWAELIDEIYVRPCALDTLAYNNHFAQLSGEPFSYPDGFDGDPTVLAATDNPNMEGGAYVTTGDYATLLLMHLRGGMCGDNQVLSQASLDLMHADRIGPTYDGEGFNADTGYGMGWWVDRVSGRVSDAGAYGTVPWLDLDDGYGAYLVIEADSTTGNELAAMLYDLVDEAVNAV